MCVILLIQESFFKDATLEHGTQFSATFRAK